MYRVSKNILPKSQWLILIACVFHSQMTGVIWIRGYLFFFSWHLDCTSRVMDAWVPVFWNWHAKITMYHFWIRAIVVNEIKQRLGKWNKVWDPNVKNRFYKYMYILTFPSSRHFREVYSTCHLLVNSDFCKLISGQWCLVIHAIKMSKKNLVTSTFRCNQSFGCRIHTLWVFNIYL